MRTWRSALGLLCLTPVLAGSALAVSAWKRRTVSTAQQDGLALRLERAGWLHMDGHDVSIPMPGMAGLLPAAGRHRLSVEVTVHNGGGSAITFGASELGLYRADHGQRLDVPDEDAKETLRPGFHLTSVMELEVPEVDGDVELRWRRTGAPIRLMTMRTPRTQAQRSLAPEAWPSSAEELPTPNARDGASLFSGRLGCVACHGRMDEPASATMGPSLAGLSARLERRALPASAAQYAYESLLSPNAFVASDCPHGRPCAVPSAMPAYGELLSTQEMADLIAFLLSSTAPPQE